MTENPEGPGFRCSVCGLDWPLIEDYRECPQCGEATEKCSNIEPMPEAEAASLKAHADFEQYYEVWDKTHSPDRLTRK